MHMLTINLPNHIPQLDRIICRQLNTGMAPTSSVLNHSHNIIQLLQDSCQLTLGLRILELFCNRMEGCDYQDYMLDGDVIIAGAIMKLSDVGAADDLEC